MEKTMTISLRSLLVASALVLSVSAAQASEEPKKEETPAVATDAAAPATTDAKAEKPVDGKDAPVAEEKKEEEKK
jgi:hypothetical protein